MPTVVISPEPLHQLEGPHTELLRSAGFEVRFPEVCRLDTEEQTIAGLDRSDAVIAGGEPLSDAVLSQLKRLRVISRTGVGYDQVDVDSATRHGIAVTITPDGNREGVAEHTLALILGLARDITGNDQDVKQGHWEKPKLVPLRGRTLGLVGFGRIGQSVAVRANGFGMKLLACDPCADEHVVQQSGVKLVDLDTLLRTSDFVSLHAPLSPQTRCLINAQSLSLMKPTCYLVNTARGGLVDEADLLHALQTGVIMGAGLDVLEQEPPPIDHPLFSLPNVLVSPHVAANDTQAIEDMALSAAQNVIDLMEGRWPADSIVNPKVRSRWSWTA